MKKLICYTITAFLMLAALTGCSNTQPAETEKINNAEHDNNTIYDRKAREEGLKVHTEIKQIPEINYGSISPLEFLDILKRHPYSVYSVISAPDWWIKYEHVKELAKYVDLEEPCARVVSDLSSYLPQKASTVGNEAIFLIEGFLRSKYPPSLHSEGFTQRDAQWYKTGWEDYWKDKINEENTFIYFRSRENSEIEINEVIKYLGTPTNIHTVYDQEELETIVSMIDHKTCIWIDREAVKGLDKDWLYKKAIEDKYPVILIGHSHNMYSFRDLLSIVRYIQEWKIPEEEIQKTGFSAYLYLSTDKPENLTSPNAFSRGFPGSVDIREVVSISKKLLTRGSSLIEDKHPSIEERLLYNFWIMKSFPDNERLINEVLLSLEDINWSKLYKLDSRDLSLIMEWFAGRSLHGDKKALKVFLENRKGLDAVYAAGYYGRLIEILEENAETFIKSFAAMSDADIDEALYDLRYELYGNLKAEKKLKENRENPDFNEKEKDVLEKLIDISYKPLPESISVKTVQELFESIGPNKNIYLEPGVYNLDEILQGDETNPYAFIQTKREDNFIDGGELVIRDVENLSITGMGKKPVEILTKHQMANVLTFIDTDNVTLSNIRAGHWPDQGGCYGGVLVFKDSSHIRIKNCSFFGCGINGLELSNVENTKFDSSIIEECSLHIMCISNSKNMVFKNSEFIRNRGTRLINISG